MHIPTVTLLFRSYVSDSLAGLGKGVRETTDGATRLYACVTGDYPASSNLCTKFEKKDKPSQRLHHPSTISHSSVLQPPLSLEHELCHYRQPSGTTGSSWGFSGWHRVREIHH